MVLSAKHPPKIVPRYSLTGDLLSYMRCGLQYRYQNGSALPPSRPVQLWFGEFIHGVMELAYQVWKTQRLDFAKEWPCNPTPWEERNKPVPNRAIYDIGVLGERVEAVLAVQGKYPRNQDVRESAYLRAKTAINEIGKHLFPLVQTAEEPLSGAREIPGNGALLRADRYELTGVVDVLSHITMANCRPDNVIRQAVESVCPNLPKEYEIIIDYKGSRRPAINESYHTHYAWQVQTYAWLRNRRPQALPVAAGILIYINELCPGSGDISALKKEIRTTVTDELPVSIADKNALDRWKPGVDTTDLLSLEYRLRRAIRVIPVTEESISEATTAFDKKVAEIELNIAAEANDPVIRSTWLASCSDEQTCVACDFQYICPDPKGQVNRKGHAPTAP